jgi:hypothetical protein
LSEGKKKCLVDKEEVLNIVYEDPELRKSFIQRIRDEVEDVLNTVLVETIKVANERPSKWWEALMFFIAGLLGGAGLGYIIAMRNVPSTPPVVRVVP